MSCAARGGRGRAQRASGRHPPPATCRPAPAPAGRPLDRGRRLRPQRHGLGWLAGAGPGRAGAAHLVRDVRPLVVRQQRDARVGLRRQHVHQRVGVPVQRHRRRRLQQLPVERAEDADVVVGAGGGAHDARVRVYHLQELADDQRHRLDALDLLLGAQQLTLQVLLLLLDVLLLRRGDVAAGLSATLTLAMGRAQRPRHAPPRAQRRSPARTWISMNSSCRCSVFSLVYRSSSLSSTSSMSTSCRSAALGFMTAAAAMMASWSCPPGRGQGAAGWSAGRCGGRISGKACRGAPAAAGRMDQRPGRGLARTSGRANAGPRGAGRGAGTREPVHALHWGLLLASKSEIQV
jgi:hypothetical protein